MCLTPGSADGRQLFLLAGVSSAEVYGRIAPNWDHHVQSPEGVVIALSGADGFPHLWFGPLVDPGTRPVHLALTAPTRAAVDQVHAAAREVGAEVLHPPRLWPEYHLGYYGCFLRDPDGNNVEAVHHSFTP